MAVRGAMLSRKCATSLSAFAVGTTATIPPEVCGSNKISEREVFLVFRLVKLLTEFLFEGDKLALIDVFSKILEAPSNIGIL